MVSSSIKPRWAVRVAQQKIRRLYESDARGILDDALVMKVGIGLYLRCKSILKVGEVMGGRIPCPVCENLVERRNMQESECGTLLHCPQCDWELAEEKYRSTYRHQELWMGGAGPFFTDYIEKWDISETMQERWRLIDRLIHLWHWETQLEGHVLGRPTGVNLIEGSRKDVIAFLDSLTYGDHASPETQANRAAWRTRLEHIRSAEARWKEERHRGSASPDAPGG